MNIKEKIEVLFNERDLDVFFLEGLFELFPKLLGENHHIEYDVKDANNKDVLYKFKDICLYQDNIIFDFTTEDPRAIAKYGTGSDLEDEEDFYCVFKEDDKYYLISGCGSEGHETTLCLYTTL